MVLPAKQEQYTFADVLTWDEGENIEIISGKAFMMATPSRIHQKISMELSRQLANFLEEKAVKSILLRLASGCLNRMEIARRTWIQPLNRTFPWCVIGAS